MEFIYEIENALSPEMCDKMIKKFQNDDRKGPSLTHGGLNIGTRKSTNLHFSGLGDWKDMDDYMFKVFSKALEEYHTYVSGYTSKEMSNGFFDDVKDEGYFVQEFRPGEYYHWHTDDHSKGNIPRNFTMLLYLNTLEEDQGGCTEFWVGKKVRPKQGKLLIFPSGWTYIHRGAPVKNGGVKYVCGTWMV